MNTCKRSLGERMKEFYEYSSQSNLVRKIPVIIRLDGKAFHTFSKKYCNKPYDHHFSNAMLEAAKDLSSKVQGIKCAYVQSDEISLLLSDIDKVETEAWFNYNIQKICSISASICSVKFNKVIYELKNIDTFEVFDARAFNIPFNEVYNYFLWRQQDCIRNSINGYARSLFSQKELNSKKNNEVKELILQKGYNPWENTSEHFKFGSVIYKTNENNLKIDSIEFKNDRSLFNTLIYGE